MRWIAGRFTMRGRWRSGLRDLHAAFADPAIDGIICTRGGWGSAELLPYLDAELIRANPKAFIGYSDHTSLHCWLHNEANLVTFYGPMVAADFSRDDGVDVRELAAWSCRGMGRGRLVLRRGLRVLRPGVARGRLDGGCISIFAEGLGTPYAPRIDDGDDSVSRGYWDEAIPVGPDAAASALFGIAGEGDAGLCLAICGSALRLEEQELLERAILHALRDFEGPIAIGLR